MNIFRSVPPLIKRRANELLDEIRAGGFRSVDIDGPRKRGIDSEQAEESGPMNDVRGDIDSESGIFSEGIFCCDVLIGVLQELLRSLLLRHIPSLACVKCHTRRQVACCLVLNSHRYVEVPEVKIKLVIKPYRTTSLLLALIFPR